VIHVIYVFLEVDRMSLLGSQRDLSLYSEVHVVSMSLIPVPVLLYHFRELSVYLPLETLNHMNHCITRHIPETPILSLSGHTLGPSRTYWIVAARRAQKQARIDHSRVFTSIPRNREFSESDK